MKKKLLTVTLALVVIAISVFFTIKTGAVSSASGDSSEQQHTSVTLTYKTKRWVYGRQDYEIDSKIHTVQQEIRDRIKPTHNERAALCKKVKDMGFTYKEAVDYAFYGLDKIIERAKKNIDLAPKDAIIRFYPDRTPMFSIREEEPGFNIDLDKLYQEIYSSLVKNPTITIKLNPEILNSKITKQLLSTATALRSRFSTNYAESQDGRKHNVQLALKKFNGMRVNPDETVSFNTTVGPRTERNGFMQAKIITNGHYEDGIGGGVCQSSTTLYNAALLAGLSIKKVSQHSLSCSYVEPSFDAMVNASSSDLVFQNTDILPVFIRTLYNNENVTVEIYGTPLPYEIRRRSVVIGIIPHEGDKNIVDTTGKYIDKVQYKGDKVRLNYPKDGLKSEGYLDYYRNGKLIESKLIRKNKYSPQQGLVVEGNKERPPEPPQITEILPVPDSNNQRLHDFFNSFF